MVEILRRLGLGLLLICLSAAVLLYTDRGTRLSARQARPKDRPLRIALVQHTTLAALDDGARGAVERLAERGFRDGERIRISHFNAEGDLGTANTIAKAVTGGDYDLIISISTPSLQTIANANRSGAKTHHVFGVVTDPAGAGVGVNPENPAEHPPYMTGYGSMQPVDQTFMIARRMYPGLKRVGLVWNAAEANSLAQTRFARKVTADMGIELIEANAENTTAVIEAASSLFSRGIDALWISGDITVSSASDSLIVSARRSGIPVFTSIPPRILQGALFDLGSDFLEVGHTIGDLAAKVLGGANPADIPVKNLVPIRFLYNELVLPGLKATWQIPDDLRATAAGWITRTSTNLGGSPSQGSKR